MSKPTIAVINASTVTPDSAFPSVVAALQKQVSGDFAPLWGKDADLIFVPKGSVPPVGCWHAVCSDTVDMAGALGYHDFTVDNLPVGKVGIQTSINDRARWEVTLGHEVLEMLGDPDIIRTAFIQVSASQNIILSYEACDAVEEATYMIDGVPMTDFVTEQWFEPSNVNGPFSFLKTVKRPLTLAPGGYIGIFRVNGGGWTQITARKEEFDVHQGVIARLARGAFLSHTDSYSKIPRVGSRRERRQRGHHAWIGSVAS